MMGSVEKRKDLTVRARARRQQQEQQTIEKVCDEYLFIYDQFTNAAFSNLGVIILMNLEQCNESWSMSTDSNNSLV
jgi:hypothetical protein